MNMFFHIVAVGLVAGVLTVGTGCTTAPRHPEATVSTPRSPDPALAKQARTVRIFRGSDGSPVSWDSLVTAASGADAVIIGENHGHKVGLAFASELWADVFAQRNRAVLSMEFFNRDEQSRLDDYLKGLWAEAAFLKATGRTSEETYPPGHRAMVEAAKTHARPVIASNSPRTYVTAARKEPYSYLTTLTSEERRMFRIPDELPTGRYRTDFEAVMSDPAMASHGGAAKKETAEELKTRLDAAFRAQSLWDWTMADSVARGIDTDGRPVVHVVGRFHSDFDGGLVQALNKIRPGTRVVTVSVVDAWSDSLQSDDHGRADFIAYVGKSE